MFICMQKIKFITQFFLTILQRNSKLVILGNLGKPGHTHTPEMTVAINLKKPVIFISRQRINFILQVFLEILQRYCKLPLGMPGHAHPKLYYDLVESFRVYVQEKINFLLHAFLEISQRYANLFWSLWAFLNTHTQTDSSNLQKTSIFSSMPRTNFTISLLS